MAGTVIADAVQAASTSQLVIKNGVALTPPTINDVNGTQIGTFCRAWVNFNGTGTVAINASFNVSSITDGGTGIYTINFTNAMPDANYSATSGARKNDATNDGDAYAQVGGTTTAPQTASACPVVTKFTTSNTKVDCPSVMVAIFR